MQFSDICPIFYSQAECEQVVKDVNLSIQRGADPLSAHITMYTGRHSRI